MFQLSLLRDSLLKILYIVNTQIYFCVGCNILSILSYLKESGAPYTSKHILVRVKKCTMHNLQKYVHKSKSSREQWEINILHQQEAESNKLQKLPVLARENLNILHVHTTEHRPVKIFTLLCLS